VSSVDIGRPKRIIEVEPALLPVPESIPMPESVPESEPVPAAPAVEPAEGAS
jgi:hypothetical protein